MSLRSSVKLYYDYHNFREYITQKCCSLGSFFQLPINRVILLYTKKYLDYCKKNLRPSSLIPDVLTWYTLRNDRYLSRHG